mgnify:CR=1 FL=1
MAKSSRKVIITCAVTGSIHTPSMSPHLPITAEEIADAAIGAADILRQCGCASGPGQWRDFHCLPSSTVARLLGVADGVNYRAPKNANGSRARYFHAALVRQAGREHRNAC